MAKTTFFLLLISLNCFSQKIGKLQFSIAEIDRLSKNESCLRFFDWSAGLTAYDGNQIEIGNGRYSIDPHFYTTDSLNYSKLTLKEKRMYDASRYCKLQRVDYKSYIDYNDHTSYKKKVQFYYDRDVLFYVRYEEESVNGAISNTVFHHFFYENIDSELNGNPNIKQWIIDQNQEIIKKCLEK